MSFSLEGVPVTSDFVGRDKELRELENVIQPQNSQKSPRRVAIIKGGPGIGKMQLVLNFMRKFQQTYSAALILDASTFDSVCREIAGLSLRISRQELSETARMYAQYGNADLDVVVRDVLMWFSNASNRHWLLFYDNFDQSDQDSYDLTRFFPKRGSW